MKLEKKIKKQSDYQNDIKVFQSKIEIAYKENSDIEELLSIQEEEIKNISLTNTKYANDISGKSLNIGNINKDLNTFSNILMEGEQTIQKLNQRIKKKEEEEIKRQNLINEKDNEIAMLKEFIESLKNNNKNKNIDSKNNKGIEEEILKDIKPELNDIEDNNFKEIADLMKKVLEE